MPSDDPGRRKPDISLARELLGYIFLFFFISYCFLKQNIIVNWQINEKVGASNSFERRIETCCGLFSHCCLNYSTKCIEIKTFFKKQYFNYINRCLEIILVDIRYVVKSNKLIHGLFHNILQLIFDLFFKKIIFFKQKQ